MDDRIKIVTRRCLGSLLAVWLLAAVSWSDEPGARFVMDGKIVNYSADSKSLADVPLKHKGPVHEFLGAMPGGRMLVSLGAPHLTDSMITGPGVEIAVLSADGAVEQTIVKEGVRAWPSPSGNRIAAIDLDYSLHLFENGALRPLNIPERVVLAAWSPDESRLCLTAYPANWSPHRAHNPESTREFLEMQNSDLYLYDPAAGELNRLTDAPGYDYNGVWYPDGGHVMFISSRDGIGAFFKVNVATGAIEKLTNKSAGSYEVPVGRSGSFVWSAKTGEWIYSAQEPDTRRDSIRALSGDGRASRVLGFGRHICLIENGRAVAFINAGGQPEIVELLPAEEN